MIKKHLTSFDLLPDNAFVRESQIVQNSKHPDQPALLPFSSATLWRKVKNQSFPAPVKLSAKITAWQVGEIRKFLETAGPKSKGNAS